MIAADGLTVTHTSTVTPDQIDHLGHMNVRHYAVNARAATRSFIGAGQIFDMYTRHHREQLLDAELEVRSRVLDITTSTDTSTTRVYHELVDTSTGEPAATFIYRVRSEGPAEHPASPASSVATFELPDHGRPRSIDLDAIIAAPSLAELRRIGLAMRAPRTLDLDDTGGGDTVTSSMMAMLFWGGDPIDDAENQLVHTGPNGENIGWATMETRIIIDRLPTVGTRIQSFSATTAVADKTTQMSMWVYDLDTDERIASFEIVSVLFDIGARRAMSIPDDMRADLLARLHPELGASRPG